MQFFSLETFSQFLWPSSGSHPGCIRFTWEFQKMFMTKPQFTLEKFIAKGKIVFKYPGNSNVQSELRSLGEG